MIDGPQYAPGTRVVIRDEEWLVRSTLPIQTGGAAVRVVGISELVRFGRHEAPVVVSPRLAAADSIYLWQGVISNQRSQPVIVDWFGARVTDCRPVR